MKPIPKIFICSLVLFSSLVATSCYKENNVLTDLVTVQGSAALIDAFTISSASVAAGTQITASVTTRSFDRPIKEVKLYAAVGTASRAVAVSVPVTFAPSSTATVQTIPYTVGANLAKGTVIVLSTGVVTDNNVENIFTTTRSVTVK